MAAVRTLSALLILALFAVQTPAEDVQPDTEGDVISPSAVMDLVKPLITATRQARQSTSTVTIIKTTTLSSVTTATVSTKKTCAVLASVSGKINGANFQSSSPSVACSRRRRQVIHDPVFVAYGDGYDSNVQFVRLHPSQVYNFHQTMLPQFRTSERVQGIELLNESPVIEGSFEKNPQNVRIAAPIFGTAISSAVSSLVSSLVSNILGVTTTTTSISTAYTSTSTSSVFTATSTYYIAGACFPAGITTC